MLIVNKIGMLNHLTVFGNMHICKSKPETRTWIYIIYANKMQSGKYCLKSSKIYSKNSRNRGKSIPLTHIDDHTHILMTTNPYRWPLTHIDDHSLSALIQARQWKVTGITYFYAPKPSLIVKWCSYATVFHMWVKCLLSHISGRY